MRYVPHSIGNQISFIQRLQGELRKLEHESTIDEKKEETSLGGMRCFQKLISDGMLICILSQQEGKEGSLVCHRTLYLILAYFMNAMKTQQTYRIYK